MKVTAEQIIEKIKDLPKGFEELVHTKGKGLAEVESFSDHTHGPWTASIQVHSTDPGDKSILDATCTCPATRLCHHITAFYAVAKKIVPIEGSSEEEESTPQGGEAKQTGSEMISDGIEKIVNGIALIVAERTEAK